MPNWCNNQLDIIGSKEQLKKVLSLAVLVRKDGKKELNCNKLCPVPKELADTSSPQNHEELAQKNTDKYGYPDWYSFCIANWGTKWTPEIHSIEIHSISETENALSISFDSAWSPPIPIVQILSKKFPKCFFTLNYFECGSCFAGIVDCKKGEIIEQSSFDEKDVEYAEIGANFFGYNETVEDGSKDNEKNDENQIKEKSKKSKKNKNEKLEQTKVDKTVSPVEVLKVEDVINKPTKEEILQFEREYMM